MGYNWSINWVLIMGYKGIISIMPKPRYRYLLDVYPSALFALGVNKLRSAYSGNNVLVVRSSDSTELDIGFDSNTIDNSGLTSFLTTNSGSVKRWYDQSTNNIELSQPAIVRQPSIYDSGTIVSSGGSTAILGGTTLGIFTPGDRNLSSISQMYFFFCLDVSNILTYQVLFQTSPNHLLNSGALQISIGSNVLKVEQHRPTLGEHTTKTYPISTGRQIITVRFRTGQTASNVSEVWINGSLITGTVTNNFNSISLVNYQIYLLTRLSSNGFLGKAQFIVVYSSSVDRVGVESILNSYLNIF